MPQTNLKIKRESLEKADFFQLETSVNTEKSLGGQIVIENQKAN